MSFISVFWYTTMPQYSLTELTELRRLPLPLSDNGVLRRRQFLRLELHYKVRQLWQMQEKRIFRVKCPCDWDICHHMDPLTENLMISWCPLEAELGHFFLTQPWAYLGVLIYPHCIECMESSVCGSSQ